MTPTPDPGTVLLIFLLLFAIGWGAIQHRRAVQNLSDRNRLNRLLKEANTKLNKIYNQ